VVINLTGDFGGNDAHEKCLLSCAGCCRKWCEIRRGTRWKVSENILSYGLFQMSRSRNYSKIIVESDCMDVVEIIVERFVDTPSMAL
ncbi:hypothetical protein Goklo_009346, partial [Gossypium klotzschianum]|nr:hypothetical protein [Gossypium klotzschianum]